MRSLIETLFKPAFSNPELDRLHDGAVLELGGTRFAFTTDSYVVHPLFFSGGDIGKLAVCGTLNDLAMCGARPIALSVGFILEEGLPMETLKRVVESMRLSAEAAGVKLVTGDTKVVDKGKGDGLFINTAGIGTLEYKGTIAPEKIQTGDAILLSGDIGRHGMAIMAAREGLSFEGAIESDCADLSSLIQELIRSEIGIHCLRDLTRGGLASALVEIAEAAKRDLAVEERAISVRQEVQGACEILGLDPLYAANEGRFIAFVPESCAKQALAVLTAHPLGQGASQIGAVQKSNQGLVTLKTAIGASRLVDMLSGEQLPRIC